MAKVYGHEEELAPNDPRQEFVEHYMELACLADIEPRSPEWIWPYHILRGSVNLWSGDPGRGKSMAAVEIAARCTTGQPMPFRPESEARKPCSVLLCTAEDDSETMLVPRALAAGADRSKLFTPKMVVKVDENRVITKTPLYDLFRQFVTIETMCRMHPDIGLIVIDPVMSFLGDGDGNSSTDVRNLLTAMFYLAQATGVSFLLVTHQNKKTDLEAMFRVQGSIGWVGCARASFAFTELVKGNREGGLMGPIKINVCKPPEPIAYRILPVTVRDSKGNPIETTKIDWVAEGKEAVEEAKGMFGGGEGDGRTPGGKPKLMQAEEFLRTYLGVGAAEVQLVIRDAKQYGIGECAIRKAANGLGMVAIRQGPGRPGMWELPKGGGRARA